MILSSSEKDGRIRFSISKYEEKYRKIFNMCFYKEEDGVFYKDFPSDYPHMNEIRENFQKHGKAMFAQLGYFSDVPWSRALSSFCRMIDGHEINWWLTGSCASCLRGIELNPHDVDIMIDSKDVPEIIDIFSDFLIEPLVNTGGWLTKDFGVIFLGARVDIASDPVETLDDPLPVDCGPTAGNNLEVINWNGFSVKIPPIEFQLNANHLRGRGERVKLIEEYMESHSLQSGIV